MHADPPLGYTLRAATLEDAGALAELFNAVTLDEVGVAWTDEADMRADLAAPGFDLANDATLVFDEAGRLEAGFLLHPDGSPVTTVLAIGLVHPESTGRGLGTYITLLAEDHARRKIPAEPPSGRFTVRTTRFVQNELAAELFRDLGYERVRTWWRMTVELGREGPAGSLPAGLEIAPFDPDQDSRRVFDALVEAFRDHWGEGMGGFEDWVDRVVDRSASRFVLIASAGDEIAGVLAGRAGLAADPGAGSIEELGVRRPWRGRGLGLALLHRAFDEFRRRGLSRARLTVDSESPTGATRLYERAGMAVELAWEHWEKELRSA
jgi:mycothiol synthase